MTLEDKFGINQSKIGTNQNRLNYISINPNSALSKFQRIVSEISLSTTLQKDENVQQRSEQENSMEL